MTLNYRDETTTVTGVAMDWTVDIFDGENIARIVLTFDSAPSTAENVIASIIQASGDQYVVASADVQAVTTIAFENIEGLKRGDSINVSFANTDARNIKAVITKFLG